MSRYLLAAMTGVLLISGFGCADGRGEGPVADEPGSHFAPSVSEGGTDEPEAAAEPEVLLPLDIGGVVGYATRYKRFGEYFDDRFNGYHTGEDAEIPPEDLAPGEEQVVPVRAVADGTVVYASRVSGYGGVIALQHEIGGEQVQTLYGHLALGSAGLKTGEVVAKGQFLANLGADRSADTDGERQHLHFAVYPGTEVRLQGYVNTPVELSAWINPYDFFQAHGSYATRGAIPDPSGDWISSYGLYYPVPPRAEAPQARTRFADLSFSLPPDWDAEYISSINALSLYKVSGTGSARERSQVLIRSYEASQFEIPSNADILSSTDLTVGQGSYAARRAQVRKRAGVLDFQDQPAWRNGEHAVTDLRASPDGFVRFYSFAANPELDLLAYDRILGSVEVSR